MAVPPTGGPKLSNGWVVETRGLGDWDGTAVPRSPSCVATARSGDTSESRALCGMTTLGSYGAHRAGLVREQLDQEHRDRMLGGMPPEMRTMWTEQMEPVFNAFVAEVRR